MRLNYLGVWILDNFLELTKELIEEVYTLGIQAERIDQANELIQTIDSLLRTSINVSVK
jgi:hypothetical protein